MPSRFCPHFSAPRGATTTKIRFLSVPYGRPLPLRYPRRHFHWPAPPVFPPLARSPILIATRPQFLCPPPCASNRQCTAAKYRRGKGYAPRRPPRRPVEFPKRAAAHSATRCVPLPRQSKFRAALVRPPGSDQIG